MSFIKMSPILNAVDVDVDVDQEGVLSAAEIADAPAQLRKLDKNARISAEEINNAAASLKTLDKNQDGRITADEVMRFLAGGALDADVVAPAS